ncbi:Alpha-ketoglutarate-dependent taurine dioxygenase [Tsuneonella dongtanensis]|uniref:Alpha-ketoglutarate-dependent taurine dioxygenase n=1 Tax=Tsuneonella dongtanensis TaxID=692370 RepID=A0A1B2ADR6_9SPHN|nr:TauD/TfdA family dioxygenase [Tsuneonella dongtanensis]ANY20302.1 Alpha-ketoglutarate-dependent taurine dioxygenase [Tsuneonella dongtanensis]
MEWTPMAEKIGAEVSGIRLADVDGAELEALKQLVYDRGVAVLRDQELSPEEHIALAERWGGIDINNYFPLQEKYPQIAIVRKAADQQTNIGGAWHTDHSYDQVPAMGSILVARTLPPSGGDTHFAHMGAAYDSLPDDLKAEIEDLKAFHTADHVYKADGIYAQTDQGADLRGHDLKTGAIHPVVIRHPHTGRKLLYVNGSFTINFVGKTREESLPLLARLINAALTEDNQCKVVWRPGTVTIWDNRTTWHNAMNDYHGHAREMHRITLSGEALAA